MKGEYDNTEITTEPANILHDLRLVLAKASPCSQHTPALTYRQQVSLIAFGKLYPDGFMTLEGMTIMAKRVRNLTDAVGAAMEEENENGEDKQAEGGADRGSVQRQGAT